MQRNYMLSLSAGLSLASLPIGTPLAALTICSNGCDFDSIYKAVYSASPGETLEILDPVWTESGIVINKDLAIEGAQPGGGQVEIDGQANDSVFIIDASAGVIPAVSISNVILSNGDAAEGGAIRLESGELKLRKCALRSNSADRGGAIAMAAGTRLRAHACSFSANLALDGAAVDCENCDQLTLLDSQLTGNTASGNGGAIRVSEANRLQIEYSRFQANSAKNGGAVYVAGTIDTQVRHSLFAQNDANHFGGGNGGALFAAGGTPNSQLVIAFSTFEENNASGGGAGGAVFLHTAGYPTSPYVTARAWNSTFHANVATGAGAIQSMSPGDVRIHNATFYENRSNLMSGSTFFGDIDLNNSIVVRAPDGFGQTDHPCESSTPLVSTYGGNLMDDPSNSCGLGNNPPTGIEPILVDVNGKRVHRIEAVSNARDMGSADCPHPRNTGQAVYFDQTRLHRLSAGAGPVCDVGAYEYRMP